MTGQHRKPGEDRQTFLVRPVDADTVREAIAGIAADAINRAAETVRKIREWCDSVDARVRSCPTGDGCSTCAVRRELVNQVRALLPDVPPAAEGVEQVEGGTRVTPGNDREY